MKPAVVDKLTREEQSLIESVTPRVLAVAAALSHRLHVHRDDLASAAHFRLMKRVKTYDPALGEFWSYVKPAVFGAMIDTAVAEGRVRAAKAVIEAAPKLLLLAPASETTDKQISNAAPAEAEGIAVDKLREGLGELAAVLALQPRSTGGEDELIENMRRASARALLMATVAKLSEHDQQLVNLLYVEGKTLAEIGQAMGGVHPRTIQRSHERVRRRLRAALNTAGFGASS
ncbi:MAG: sigma-70 family RNA polymerase sigma factor [Polyangiaceae bacterium]|nr:sigma-70 family RNA polymerase sigma factor [Polyangiaceae bacterium]